MNHAGNVSIATVSGKFAVEGMNDTSPHASLDAPKKPVGDIVLLLLSYLLTQFLLTGKERAEQRAEAKHALIIQSRLDDLARRHRATNGM